MSTEVLAQSADVKIEGNSGEIASEVSPRSSRPCLFFAKGNCRNGVDCKFSHDSPSANQMLTPPPPVIINIQPGCPVYSIDVECVASGVEHNARSVAQIAVVDEWNRPVLNVLIKQEQPVASYITELTGLTKELIDTHGVPLEEALKLVRASIPNNAIIIGTNILKDIQWMGLAENNDYASMVDLTALFRVWNPTRGEFTAFSQDHCAKVWLGIGDRPNHNALEDAIIAMSLFNTYRTIQWDPMTLYQLQMATMAAPRTLGFSSRNPTIDGCCMGNRKQCSCGAPFM